MARDAVVIGIDGGGTNTRVMICDLEGNELAYVEGGCASRYKDEKASENVQAAIREALAKAGRAAEDAVGLVAGIAGYESAEDATWIASFTDLPGLRCPKLHLNDSDIAHAGALGSQPGIIVIAGTGTMIMGVNESGRRVSNLDYHHYAYSAARHLAYDAVYEVLTGMGDGADEGLVCEMLRYWQADGLERLQEQARQGFHPDKMKRDQLFGLFAPRVTLAAEQGSGVARRVCDRAAEQLRLGVELVGSSFAGDGVEAALIGSVARSPYMVGRLRALLETSSIRRYRIVEPQFPPVVGAVLLAYRELGLSTDVRIAGRQA